MARLPAALRPLWPYAKLAYTASTRVAAPMSSRLSRLRGGWVPRTAVGTFDAAVVRDGDGQVEEVRPAETLRRAVPQGHPDGGSVFADQVVETVPRVAVAELRDGRVLGPHAAIVSRSGALVVEAGPYFGTRRPSEHPVHLNPFPPSPLVVHDRLGVLATRGDANYYHFLLDVLPKLGVLEQAQHVKAPDLWFAPRATGFQRELLELAGVSPAQVIDSSTVPHVQADELVVPGIPDAHLRTPPWVVQWLHERFGSAHDRAVRRLYVTRGHVPNSRIVRNEDEVLAALEPFGFERVDPGALTAAEQIRTFGEAAVVVAPHGAALANLVFAPPGARVLELFAPDYVQGCYWKIAACIPEAHYRYLVGEGPSRPDAAMRGVASDITVRVPDLLDQLRALEVR